MANGGKQRGVYGRAESPYNADYLNCDVRVRLVQRFRYVVLLRTAGPLVDLRQCELRYGLLAGGPTPVTVLPLVWSTRTAPSHWSPSV